MDPEQVHSEMKATRERIDRKLDLLQSRVAESRGSVTRAAVGGGVLVSIFYLWSRLRNAFVQRRRARP